MKSMKCNGICIDMLDDKHYNWFLKMVKLNIVKDVKMYINWETGLGAVTFTSLFKRYIFWRNDRFLRKSGKDQMIVAYQLLKNR